MDVPASGDVEVIPLRYAVASDIAPMIQRLSDSPTGAVAVPGAGGAATLAAPSILVDTRSNSLIVRSPNPARMSSLRALIAKLDVPLQGSAATGNIWVVHLRNADATKLATVIRAAFSAGSGGGASAGGGANTPSAPLGANPAGTAGTVNTGADRPRRRRRSRRRRARRRAASSRPIRRPTRSSSPRPSRSTARCAR